MRGSGGTDGGVGKFVIGFALSALATYLFFDSVRVGTGGMGAISGMFAYGQGGYWQTTSLGIIFVPLFLAVVALFYDATMTWAWWLMYFGLGVIAVEILSRLQFYISMKSSHLIGMIVLFAAGVGLMIRSYADDAKSGKQSGPPTDG